VPTNADRSPLCDQLIIHPTFPFLLRTSTTYISNTMSDTLTLTWSTHEREYSRFQDRFLKRSLRPTKYKLDFHSQLYIPVTNEARLENETDCLRFIKDATNIPVPKVLIVYKKDGSFFL
jgi:hypothetical protein